MSITFYWILATGQRRAQNQKKKTNKKKNQKTQKVRISLSAFVNRSPAEMPLGEFQLRFDDKTGL